MKVLSYFCILFVICMHLYAGQPLDYFPFLQIEQDTDGDGLTDFEELYLYETDIDDVDTDADGLTDWEERNIYGTRPNLWDTDGDGLSDGEEVLDFKTNPLKKSTDGDTYDDMMEIYGTNGTDDMPGWVKAPGDNVFVAAYPVIEIVVDANISIEAIYEVTFLEGGSFVGTQGYSVANTQGSSYSVGTTESHTTGGWTETSNEEADMEQKTDYEEQISTKEEKLWTGFSVGTKTEVEVGAEAEVSVGVTGPKASAKVYGSVKNTVETGAYGDNYQGHANTTKTGGEVVKEKIRKTSTSHGEKQESTFSTTITRTSYNETTTTNTQAISKGSNWSTAETENSAEAGILSFKLWIKNTGSDVADDIENLRFNIYIGGDLAATYPPLNEPAFSTNNVFPGESIEIGVDVIITLEEMGAIDDGNPIKVLVADYSFGQKEQDYMNAWSRDVLVEIDDGVEDGDEFIDYYMTFVNYNETYLDVLKRLNTEVQIGDPYNKRREIELSLDEDYITSIVSKPVTEWSWWNIYIQDLDNTADKFSEQPATKQSRLQLVYYKDSDHDYYTDRTELKIGTDPQDVNDHPSPILIAGKVIEDQGNYKSIKLKFTNSGNYDAYGIEAILYSPDSTTVIDPNQLIGGGGRIEAGMTFTPDEILTYTEDVNDCNEPVVLIRYNDPQGSHTFITTLDISDDPNQSIENISGDMLPTELTVQSNDEYTYNQDNWLIVDYFNPGPTIQNAEIIIAYQDPNGVLFSKEIEAVDLVQGHNSSVFYWNPTNYLPDDSMGNQYKAVVIVSDCHGVELMWDVVKFTIVPYPVAKLVDTFFDGLAEKNIVFTSDGSMTEYIVIPNSHVSDASLTIEGLEFQGQYPTNPSMKIGDIGEEFDWLMNNSLLKGQNCVLNSFDNCLNQVIIDFSSNKTRTLFVTVPSSAIIKEFKFDMVPQKSETITYHVYDECNNYDVDQDLWNITSVNNGGTISYTENNQYLHQYVSSENSYTDVATNMKSNSLPVDLVDEILMSTSILSDSWNDNYISISHILKVFGSPIYSFNYYDDIEGLLNIDESDWKFTRNQTGGFDCYKNNLFQNSFDPISPVLLESDISFDPEYGGRGYYYTNLNYLYYGHFYYPTNLAISIGEVEQKQAWKYRGEIDSNIFSVDISTQMNEYVLNSALACENEKIIPINFSSETSGMLLISNLNVIYNSSKTKDISDSINAYVSSQNSSSICLTIPFHYNLNSAGILNVSDLKIIYEPTNSEKSNLDFINSVDINDLSIFAEDYLKTGNYLLGDINRDNTADLKDFSLLAQYWLSECGCD